MNESKFTGGVFGLLGINILTTIISIITLGIGVPFAVCMKERWMAKHTIIDGRQLVFVGSAVALWGNYIKWFLLTIITLGIYGFWLGIKMKQWVTKNTHYIQ